MISLPFPKKDAQGEIKLAPGKQPGQEPGHQGKHEDSVQRPGDSDAHDLCKRRAAVLRRIIERYREHIEAGEMKTVPDLRNLIDPKNKAIREVMESIEEQFHPYLYEANFEQASGIAFEFMRDQIGNEALPIDFWLAPEDVLELRLADEMDKAIFLCSLLIALDNETAKVVVETNGTRHAFVLFEFKGKFYLMDPVHNVNISGSREEVLKAHLGTPDSNLGLDESHTKVVYEFNHKGYEEW